MISVVAGSFLSVCLVFISHVPYLTLTFFFSCKVVIRECINTSIFMVSYISNSRAAGTPLFGGGGHLGTTFSIIYQIKAYYLSCSETLVSVAVSRGDLRKPHVSMATNIRLIVQIYWLIEMKMHFSCNKNSRKNFQHLMMLKISGQLKQI